MPRGRFLLLLWVKECVVLAGVRVELTGWHKELVPAISLFGMVVVDAVRTLCAVILKPFFQNTLLHLFLHGLVDDACSRLLRQE